MSEARAIHVQCRREFAMPEGQGLLAQDARARTLRKVLVSYPEVRHIRPDRISLDAATDARTIDTVVKFLERQHWLVASVAIE
jgi:hypothetical protein